MMNEYLNGKGAQIAPRNPYHKHYYVEEHHEGIDDVVNHDKKVKYSLENAKKIVNKVDSPDLNIILSANPYQGCSHGCTYCYARRSHEYWGYNAGLDFETKIMVKKNAPILLSQYLKKVKEVIPIAVSGNTDCYQPGERKFQLTRKMLEVFLKYKYPVGIITKNTLILRDSDILQQLAKNRLVHVYFSITSLDEQLRRLMEPRTATAYKKFNAIQKLTQLGVPCGVMTAPIIPGLNQHEIPKLVKKASESGACKVGYTVVRLNGTIKEIFFDWLEKNFPDRHDKVYNQVSNLHGGKVNDTNCGRRLSGEGKYSEVIKSLFNQSVKKYMTGRTMPAYNLDLFSQDNQLQLF